MRGGGGGGVYYLQGQGHSEGLFDRNTTLYIISAELFILLHSKMVWWYIIVSQSALWKNWITAFQVRSQQRVRMSMFVQMISSKPPNIWLPNFALWCTIMSRSVIEKDRFAILKVKVTPRAHKIKLSQFLQYLLASALTFLVQWRHFGVIRTVNCWQQVQSCKHILKWTILVKNRWQGESLDVSADISSLMTSFRCYWYGLHCWQQIQSCKHRTKRTILVKNRW